MKRINKQQDVGYKFVEFNEGQQTEPITIEQYNKEIDEALADVAQGNFITQEELEKQSAQLACAINVFVQSCSRRSRVRRPSERPAGRATKA